MKSYLRAGRHFTGRPWLARIACTLAITRPAYADNLCPPGQFRPLLPFGDYDTLAEFLGAQAAEAIQESLPYQACPAGSAAIVVQYPGFSGPAEASYCTPCGPGTIANGNQSLCVNCTAGTYSNDGQHCHRRGVGRYSAAAAGSCPACKAGAAPNIARTACDACKPGHYSADGVSCKTCPTGSTAGVAGASSCVPCTGNSVSNADHAACTCGINMIFGPGGCVACPQPPVGQQNPHELRAVREGHDLPVWDLREDSGGSGHRAEQREEVAFTDRSRLAAIYSRSGHPGSGRRRHATGRRRAARRCEGPRRRSVADHRMGKEQGSGTMWTLRRTAGANSSLHTFALGVLFAAILLAFASPAQAKHPCPPGQLYFPQAHQCVRHCEPGTVPNVQTGECVLCPKGSFAYGNSFCICLAVNTIIQSGVCTPCPPHQAANPSHTSCSGCPLGTTFQYGNCVKTQASPGIVPSTPVLGTQGPGAVGTPLGSGPPGRARGPAGVR